MHVHADTAAFPNSGLMSTRVARMRFNPKEQLNLAANRQFWTFHIYENIYIYINFEGLRKMHGKLPKAT